MPDAEQQITSVARAVRHLDDCEQRVRVAREQLARMLGPRHLVRLDDRLWVSSVPPAQLRCVAVTQAGERCRNLVDTGPPAAADAVTGAPAFVGRAAEAVRRQRCPTHLDTGSPDVAERDPVALP